jgi:two-component system, NtrC family, nitrogen regulation sensor histidine kinase NtrY
MADRINKHTYLILAVICFAIAFFLENTLFNHQPEKKLISHFQKRLTEKESVLIKRMDEIATLSLNPGFSDKFLSELSPFNLLLEKEGMGFLVYRNRKLLYWSDRAIAFKDHLPLSPDSYAPFIFFPNGYYLADTLKVNEYNIVGLILVKHIYLRENQYLISSFNHDFKLPADFRVISSSSTTGYPIVNLKKEHIFSISPQGDLFFRASQQIIPAILYLVGLLLILIYSRKIIAGIKGNVLFRLLLTGVFLFVIYWIHLVFHVPVVLNDISFFSPSFFALNFWLPSLGDFFIASFFLFYFILNVYWDLRLYPVQKNLGIPFSLLSFILVSFSCLMFLVVDHFTIQLIYNSSLSFTLNKINEITLHTAIGIISVMFLLFGFVLLSVRINDEIRKVLPNMKIAILTILSIPVPLLIHWIISGEINFRVLMFFLIISVISFFYTTRITRKYGMSYLILGASVMTIYSIDVIYRITEMKEKEGQKLMAGTLIAEHDPAAEVFLMEIQEQINVDPNIPRYLIPPFDHLEDYLENTYFSGFFRQYDLQITICTGADSVTLQPQNVRTPCFPFFDKMFKEQGNLLPGTNFFYMDNMDGRISYFGNLHYPLASDSIGVSVFIELKSKIQSEGIGFPELLIDQSMRKPNSYKRFSYAKYFGGELVDRHGEYPYNYYIYSYNFGDGEFSYNSWDGYDHLVYRTREDNYVIVSRSLYSFVDYLISFPYLFVVYFLFSLAVMPLVQPLLLERRVSFDLKFRIQAAIISIVFISLLVVALSTIVYNLDESKTRLREDLDQKMNSISYEIDTRLENEQSISPEMKEWLIPEMVRLSNVFQSDINIFGVDGNLIASSRSEIFNRGLVSNRINTQAYYELFENFQTNYFQPEKIGELSYLSAYEPIISNSGDYLGFINLPYFTHQDRYSQEITTYIVAFINLYVLLLLVSMVVAIFIANQITLPLVTIMENLRKIELGKRNEPISYSRKDEIGILVKEYNKKVDELAVSAELLARSERESAWREMAKQVAHEIKNPLTPMKLNIQHLQRFQSKGEEYHAYVNRIAQTLINQIDNLSDIATEFSNFAQIPTAMKQVFNLSAQIVKVIELYENHDMVQISLDKGECSTIKVNADREQLSRALINLIKNGIQAIPEEREGHIRIAITRKDHRVIVSVADNGSGIPPELQEKMFNPNFTTKSSGMGLGLAIVKNIAENFNGRVWFETAINEGTTFYLEIPVYSEPETVNSKL